MTTAEREVPSGTAPIENAGPRVVVFGTEWCAATQMARRRLEDLGIPYQYRDMDADPEAERRVRWWSGGDASHPTILVGTDILIEPTPLELGSALVKHGLLHP